MEISVTLEHRGGDRCSKEGGYGRVRYREGSNGREAEVVVDGRVCRPGETGAINMLGYDPTKPDDHTKMTLALITSGYDVALS